MSDPSSPATEIFLASDGTLCISGWRGASPIPLPGEPAAALKFLRRVLAARAKATALSQGIGSDAQPLVSEVTRLWGRSVVQSFRDDQRAAALRARAAERAEVARHGSVEEIFDLLTQSGR